MGMSISDQATQAARRLDALRSAASDRPVIEMPHEEAWQLAVLLDGLALIASAQERYRRADHAGH